ncbi:hypothetical protein JW868_01395 [Candidatus Woesearchaeota archaeon]|nr:hypothetical protein [Candidatus Woesearchaeota archaeon]
MPNDIPIEHVKKMREQGFDNTQIITALQNDGYSSTQIFDAMNQVEMEPNGQPSLDESTPTEMDYPPGAGPQAESGNDPSSERVSEPEMDTMDVQPMENRQVFNEPTFQQTPAPKPSSRTQPSFSQDVPQKRFPPAQDTDFAGQPYYGEDTGSAAPRPSQAYSSGMSAPSPVAPAAPPVNVSLDPTSSDTEELVEAIIDEKWKDMVADIQKVIEWKNVTETKITTIEQKFKDLQSQFDNLHKALIGKISDYDKNILDVGAELKAMEKVFSNILPTFTKNVQELNNIANRMQGGQGYSQSNNQPPNPPRM